jgi:Ca2+/Na+ antiporter
MNDIFIEQLVKRKRRVKDTVTFITLIFLVVMIPVLFVVLAVEKIVVAYFIYIALFLLFFGVWLVWFVRSNQNVEYEYQMVQESLVVSKITAKRKRKEMLRVDVKLFDLLAPAEDDSVKNLNFLKVYEACADYNDDVNTYYAVYQHPAYGRTALFFTPNEKILNAMKPYLKKDIVLKLFYNRK